MGRVYGPIRLPKWKRKFASVRQLDRRPGVAGRDGPETCLLTREIFRAHPWGSLYKTNVLLEQTLESDIGANAPLSKTICNQGDK